MIEIAGLLVSAVGLGVELRSKFNDWARWSEKDLPVDGEYLRIAIEKGVILGAESDFVWTRLDKVATSELSKNFQVYFAINEGSRTRYRIVQLNSCRLTDLVLMKRISS